MPLLKFMNFGGLFEEREAVLLGKCFATKLGHLCIYQTIDGRRVLTLSDNVGKEVDEAEFNFYLNTADELTDAGLELVLMNRE